MGEDIGENYWKCTELIKGTKKRKVAKLLTEHIYNMREERLRIEGKTWN